MGSITSPQQLQHTLFAWVRGAFPRRIAYQLLAKGIVASPADLIASKTQTDSFRINVATFQVVDGVPMGVDADPLDPMPKGKSTPSLRITDIKTGEETWIHESTAIALYVEDLFADMKPLISRNPVQRAVTVDMMTLINLLLHDSGYYLRHAAATAAMWSHLANEDRSSAAALNGLAHMNRSLEKLQKWAEPQLLSTGWLTPGVEGHPGVVDMCLAGPLRYLWLAYEFDLLEGENLGLLREWWARFKMEGWWDELEEREGVHPPELTFGKASRDV